MVTDVNVPVPPQDLAAVAAALARELEGSSERALAVGAVRRKEAARELEFLVLPRMAAADLFGDAEPDVTAVAGCMGRWGEVARRGEDTLVCSARVPLPSGSSAAMRVSVYLAPGEPAWGVLTARRTGPPSFFRSVVETLEGRGYRLDEAASLLRTPAGAVVAVPDEETLFRLAGMSPVPPEERYRGSDEGPAAPGQGAAPRSQASRNHGEHQGRGMPIERD